MARNKRKARLGDAKSNARKAWFSSQIAQGKTDATLIVEAMSAFPGLSEKIARQELREVYERFSSIHDETAPFARTKFLQLGFELLEEMRQGCAYGPAAGQFKTLAQIAGVVQDKVQVDQTISSAPAPGAEVVRDRISTLINDPKIKERAKKLGLDLDDVDV